MLAFYTSTLESEEEKTSFSEFYQAHRGVCLKAALAITQNHMWAEEALQDAFLRMIRHKENISPIPVRERAL